MTVCLPGYGCQSQLFDCDFDAPSSKYKETNIFQLRARQSYSSARLLDRDRTALHNGRLISLEGGSGKFNESRGIKTLQWVNLDNATQDSIHIPSSSDLANTASSSPAAKILVEQVQADPADREQISHEVRKAMRKVPYPVVIITSTDNSSGEPIFRGATVSSFNTVTITPEVTVSLNIKLPSRTFNAIQTSGYFVAHLLASNDGSVDLAQTFTKPGGHSRLETLARMNLIERASVSDQGMAGNSYPPIIKSSRQGDSQVVHCLMCRRLREKSVRIGDHVVIFGVVEHISSNVQSTEYNGLIYAEGRYGQFAAIRTAASGTKSEAGSGDGHSWSSLLRHEQCSRSQERLPRITNPCSPPTWQDVASDLPTNITRTAYNNFILKLKCMDHSPLSYSAMSSRLIYTLPAKYKMRARERQRVLRKFYVQVLEPLWLGTDGEESRDVGSTSRPMTSLSTGMLQAVSLFSILLEAGAKSLRTTDLPPQTEYLLHNYRGSLDETGAQIWGIERMVKAVYMPSTVDPRRQPLLSDLYSIRKAPKTSFDDHLHYLKEYISHCILPISLPSLYKSKDFYRRRTAIRRSIYQYNMNITDVIQMTVPGIASSNGTEALVDPKGHNEARKFILKTHLPEILLSGARSSVQGRRRNVLVKYGGLPSVIIPKLLEYNDICETTFAALRKVKGHVFKYHGATIVSSPHEKSAPEPNEERDDSTLQEARGKVSATTKSGWSIRSRKQRDSRQILAMSSKGRVRTPRFRKHIIGDLRILKIPSLNIRKHVAGLDAGIRRQMSGPEEGLVIARATNERVKWRNALEAHLAKKREKEKRIQEALGDIEMMMARERNAMTIKERRRGKLNAAKEGSRRQRLLRSNITAATMGAPTQGDTVLEEQLADDMEKLFQDVKRQTSAPDGNVAADFTTLFASLGRGEVSAEGGRKEAELDSVFDDSARTIESGQKGGP